VLTCAARLSDLLDAPRRHHLGQTTTQQTAVVLPSGKPSINTTPPPV